MKKTEILIGILFYFILVVLWLVFRFESYNFLLLFLFIPCIVFIYIILTYIRFRSNIKKVKDIDKILLYYREIPSSLSPAVLSYLYNDNIEYKKDIVANLLNMCSKKSIKINFDGNKIINIEDLKNVDSLNDDELYLYKTTVRHEMEFKYEEWISIIEQIIESKNLFKKEKINLTSFVIILFIMSVISLLFSIALIPEKILNNFLFLYLIMVFSLFILIFIVNFVTRDTKGFYYYNSYTREGAKEMNKWLKLKQFIKVFSILKDRSLENIYNWEQYLAYAVAFNINHKYKDIRIKDINRSLKNDIVQALHNYVNDATE